MISSDRQANLTARYFTAQIRLEARRAWRRSKARALPKPRGALRIGAPSAAN